MEHQETLDVIAVGAHPDDVEIGCGGTLAIFVKLGYRVGIVDLTDGEPTPLSPGPDVRLAESRSAAKVLGVHVRKVLDLPNRRLFDSFEARVALATEFRRFRPQLVLGMAGKTPMASPDHWQAAQITDAAVFYSRLTKWDSHFEGLPVHKIQRQLYYHLSFEAGAVEQAGVPIIQDISETLAQKLEAIACYKTQFPPEKSHVLERVRGLAISAGMTAGFAAGERIYSLQAIGTQDILQIALKRSSLATE